MFRKKKKKIYIIYTGIYDQNKQHYYPRGEMKIKVGISVHCEVVTVGRPNTVSYNWLKMKKIGKPYPCLSLIYIYTLLPALVGHGW